MNQRPGADHDTADCRERNRQGPVLVELRLMVSFPAPLPPFLLLSPSLSLS